MSRPFDVIDLPDPGAFSFTMNGVPNAIEGVSFIDDTHIEIDFADNIGLPPLLLSFDSEFSAAPWTYDSGASDVPSWDDFELILPP